MATGSTKGVSGSEGEMDACDAGGAGGGDVGKEGNNDIGNVVIDDDCEEDESESVVREVDEDGCESDVGGTMKGV